MNAGKWKYKPNTVQIELVQGCNRRCSFCGTAGIEKKIHTADLNTVYHTCELIKRAELNSRILLAGHGEPTLHPEVVKMVKTVRTILPNSTIHMFTNGTIIIKKPELTAELFKAGLNDLAFDEYSDSRIGTFVRRDPVCRRFKIEEQGPGTPLLAEKTPRRNELLLCRQ